MGSTFGVIAREWEPKTVSVFRAPAGADRVCVGDMQFDVDQASGTVMLPDVLGRQLELARVGRHATVKAFSVTEAGDVVIEPYEAPAAPPSVAADAQEPASTADATAPEDQAVETPAVVEAPAAPPSRPKGAGRGR